MIRVKRGNVARKSHKKVLRIAKGYVGSHSRLFRVANQQVSRALYYSYSGRKNRKRWFRKLWISRINIAARNLGLNYSQFMYKVKCEKIALNRKMLSHLAIHYPKTWSVLFNTNAEKTTSIGYSNWLDFEKSVAEKNTNEKG